MFGKPGLPVHGRKSPAKINYGKRGKRVLKQILCCNDCGRQFRKQEEAFAKLQTDPRMISLILSMHCRVEM
jgi:hypothetical protein